jgi:hypothetical protein
VRDAASTIKLDGREFHGITLTTNQDDYIIGHLSLSGALEVLGDMHEKRTPKKRDELYFLIGL